MSKASERKASSIERGLDAARAGDFQRARIHFTAALKANPGDFDALQLLGNVHLSLNDFTRAQEAFRRALEIDPEFPPLLMNSGVCLARKGEHEAAVDFFDRALRARPAYADALFNKAISCNVLRRTADALACLDSVADSYGERFDYLLERATALADSRRFDEAFAWIDRALAREPRSWKAFHARGGFHLVCGRFAEAMADESMALSLAPNEAGVRINLAYLQLGARDFRNGWEGYEHRFEANLSDLRSRHDLAETFMKTPLVRKAEALARARVLAVGEQGLGDTIMFASILPDLLALTPEVDVCVEPRLDTLFARSFPAARMQPWADLRALAARRTYDRVIALGSLGRLFRQDAADFTGTAFLTADPRKTKHWRERLPAEGRLRVGVSWRGGTVTTRVAQRSLDLADFAPLLAREDCAFVSLQHGDVAQEIAAFIEGNGGKLVSFAPSETHDLDDLAALVAACDVVVTVQNTNVHLAGALGVPCLALLPAVPEWRYGVDGEKMVWYRSVELFRRTPQVELATLLERISSRLDGMGKHQA
jgi:tetratricopeptide (TPR) repeat protein